MQSHTPSRDLSCGSKRGPSTCPGRRPSWDEGTDPGDAGAGGRGQVQREQESRGQLDRVNGHARHPRDAGRGSGLPPTHPPSTGKHHGAPGAWGQQVSRSPWKQGSLANATALDASRRSAPLSETSLPILPTRLGCKGPGPAWAAGMTASRPTWGSVRVLSAPPPVSLTAPDPSLQQLLCYLMDLTQRRGRRINNALMTTTSC